MLQINERIYYSLNDEKTDQPFVYYIKGNKLSLQIDAGNSPEKYYQFLKEAKELGLKKPDLLILTHWHWDHTFGMCAAEAVTIACKKTNEQLKAMSKWSWDEASMKERLINGQEIEFCDTCIKEQYPDTTKIKVVAADIEFEEQLVIDLGGVTAYIINHDSPHTRDSVFIYLPELKVLIAGDGEYEDYYLDGKYNKNRVKDYISFLNNLEFDYYLRGHDVHSVTKKEILEFLLRVSEYGEKDN